MFQSIHTTIIASIQKQKPLGKCSGWITDSVIDHTISISEYDPLERIILSKKRID